MEYDFEIGPDQRDALGCYQIIYYVRRVVYVHAGDISHDGRLISFLTHTPIALVSFLNDILKLFVYFYLKIFRHCYYYYLS